MLKDIVRQRLPNLRMLKEDREVLQAYALMSRDPAAPRKEEERMQKATAARPLANTLMPKMSKRKLQATALMLPDILLRHKARTHMYGTE